MGRCMFFTVLLCLMVSLSVGNISTTTVNTTDTASSSATPDSSSTTTVETSTTSTTTPTPTAPTTTTTGSSTTITTVLTTGNTSTTTDNTTDTASSSATPDSSSTTTVETSTTSTPTPTAPTTATTGSSTTITTVLTTGNTSTTTDNTTDTASSSATPDSSSTATVETSTTSTTTPTEELCKSSPCGGKLSTCVPLNTTYTCQCPYEFYYYNNNCHRGKVFPGIITLAQTLSSDIRDVNSVEYEKMFQNLTQFFKQAFKNMMDYRQTIIVKADYTGEDTRTRSGNPATVTVMNIFTENTTETDAKVGEAITRALTISSYVSAYTNTTQCAVFPCDDATTTCEDGPYPVCVCKANFAKTQWDTYSCSDCLNCIAEENKFCDRRSDIPDCKCMDNFKKEGEKCVRCPVGYSGENCENNKELILIIVGTVFGAIILCLVAAVSIVSVRAKHSHDPEKKRLIKPRNSNSNTSEETRIFPRVQTTSGHSNPGYQPNNPYEVDSSKRGVFVEKDFDDLYEISRQPEGFRMQRR